MMNAKDDLPLPSHHPVEEYLFDYAMGRLPEAWSLAVATHLTFCPDCRRRIAAYEAMAGAVVAAAEAAPLRPGSLDTVLSRLDAGDDAPAGPAGPAGQARLDGLLLPAPLRAYVGEGAAGPARWRRVMSGLEEIRLPVGGAGQKVVLMRIQPGRAMPWHTHRGEEMTVVLDGGFTDASGAFRRGDCALLDSQIDHQPVAMEDGPCTCLAVTDAPLKLTGPIGRWLNPLLRH